MVFNARYELNMYIHFIFINFLYNVNLLKSTGYVMYQQFNIQQLCALSTLCLCALYLPENKKRLVPLTS
jgi:hypothetical protein